MKSNASNSRWGNRLLLAATIALALTPVTVNVLAADLGVGVDAGAGVGVGTGVGVGADVNTSINGGVQSGTTSTTTGTQSEVDSQSSTTLRDPNCIPGKDGKCPGLGLGHSTRDTVKSGIQGKASGGTSLEANPTSTRQ